MTDDEKFRRIFEGIRYLVGDNKHLREDLHEFARQAAEDRRRGDDDRRRAEEDRRRADERFELLVKRSDRQFRELVRGVVRVARRIEGKQDHHTGILERHTKLLGSIDKLLRCGANGKPGSSKSSK